MLVIRIELWPKGDESRAREIGRGLIANVGGTDQVGDYEVRLLKSAEYAKSYDPRRPGVWRRGTVAGFPRLRLGPWDLLLRALVAACGARSPEAVARLATLDEFGGAALDAPAQAELHAVIGHPDAADLFTSGDTA